MADESKKVLLYVVRHGETAWSLSGQHTGRNDLPLTIHGEEQASCLKNRLAGIDFSHVFTSPFKRAERTCQLAGFGSAAAPDPELCEWNYGDYEGLKSSEIRATRAGWTAFRDGFPGGETIAEIGARVDRVLSRIRRLEGNVLVFAHGHFLRICAARWLELPPEDGRHFVLGTTAVSILGYDPSSLTPAVVLWNDLHHLKT
jgi:probable phosphoglycerate mutase